MTDFEFSSINLHGIKRVLDARGLTAGLLGQLSDASRAALSNPTSQRWYAGAVMLDIWDALAQHHGWRMVEELNFLVTSQSLGPIVRPLAKVALVLAGNSPAVLLSRMSQFSSMALRNVRFGWTETTKSSGEFTLAYPRPVPAQGIDAAWRGVFRFSEELSGKTVRVERFEPRADNTFAFQLSW